MMSELQNKLAGDVQKVEVDILPRKVDKEDLQLPENLVEQIDKLKQGLNELGKKCTMLFCAFRLTC